MPSDDTTLDVPTPTAMGTQAVEYDLVDRMRRLSVGSATSSYSFISEARSVLSLDTNGSVNGGISIDAPTINALQTCLEVLTVVNNKFESINHDEASTNTTGPATATYVSDEQPDASTTSSQPSLPSPYWLQFFGFEPSPTAKFKKELARLAKHENWSNKEKRKQQVKALAAEIAHHYGTHLNKLNRWQQLCEDVGIDVVPKSITQCRKVSIAMRSTSGTTLS
jgi:hypothetical protein